MIRNTAVNQPVSTVKFSSSGQTHVSSHGVNVVKTSIAQSSYATRLPAPSVMRVTPQAQVKPSSVLTTAVLQNQPSRIAQTFLQSQNAGVTTVKTTPSLANATIIQPSLVKNVPTSGNSLLLPSQASIKTLPVLQTSTSRAPVSHTYQQPVTVTFLNTLEPGQLLNTLLFKPISRVESSNQPAPGETLQYVLHNGRIQNVYVPTQTGFQIPISGNFYCTCVYLKLLRKSRKDCHQTFLYTTYVL